MMQDEFNEEYEDVVDHSVFICTEETDQYSSSKVFYLLERWTGQISSSYALFFYLQSRESTSSPVPRYLI